MIATHTIAKGMKVIGADDEVIGKISQRGTGRSLVEHGTVVKEQLIVDDDLVQEVRKGVIYLSVTREELEGPHMVQDSEPPALMAPIDLAAMRDQDAAPKAGLPRENEHVATTGGGSAKPVTTDGND